jgi:hypothetical protein
VTPDGIRIGVSDGARRARDEALPAPANPFPGDEQDHILRQRMELERARTYGLRSVISAMCILNSLNPTWRNDAVLARELEEQVRQVMMDAGPAPDVDAIE